MPRQAGPQAAWAVLRHRLAAQAAGLTAPRPGAPGLCALCLGPASRGRHCCFPCELHAQCAPGGLADIVVPVAYAPKGSRVAGYLWQYKSAVPGSGTAAAFLLALLLVFLHEHGRCLWRAASMRPPTHLAVVPSSRGRAGPHPLRALVSPYLLLPWAGLVPRLAVRQPVRDLDPARFAADRLPGARVLLIDDTWTTGSSAQSAAMALRLAGASSVAIVVLGRHLAASRRPARPATAGPPLAPGAMPFLLDCCAVHDAALPLADRTLGW